MKFLENVARDLCACQRLVNFWDGDEVISYRKPVFQEESFMKIGLVSNNSGTSKIHFVVVFVDMTRDLGVMVEHRNSPFMFCKAGFQWSFSLTVVYKTIVGATDFVHYARLWPVNLFLCFQSREQTVHSSQWFEGDLDLLLP